MESIIPIIVVMVVVILGVIIAWKIFASLARKKKNIERAMKLVTMQIHLPPSTDDIQGGGRDERDVANEEISKAQVMYGILSSTLKKGLINKFYGQRAISFEIISNEGLINYYAVVPAVLTETVRQAVTAAYPTARLEEVRDPNFFNKEGGINGVCGGEFLLQGRDRRFRESGRHCGAVSAGREDGLGQDRHVGVCGQPCDGLSGDAGGY